MDFKAFVKNETLEMTEVELNSLSSMPRLRYVSNLYAQTKILELPIDSAEFLFNKYGLIRFDVSFSLNFPTNESKSEHSCQILRRLYATMTSIYGIPTAQHISSKEILPPPGPSDSLTIMMPQTQEGEPDFAKVLAIAQEFKIDVSISFGNICLYASGIDWKNDTPGRISLSGYNDSENSFYNQFKNPPHYPSFEEVTGRVFE